VGQNGKWGYKSSRWARVTERNYFRIGAVDRRRVKAGGRGMGNWVIAGVRGRKERCFEITSPSKPSRGADLTMARMTQWGRKKGVSWCGF